MDVEQYSEMALRKVMIKELALALLEVRKENEILKEEIAKLKKEVNNE